MSEVKKRATDDGCSIVLHQTNDGHHHWLCPNCKRENVSPVGAIDLSKFLPSVVCSECGFEFGVDKSALPVTKTNQPDLIAEVEELLAKATPGPWFDWDTGNWLYDPKVLLANYDDAILIVRSHDDLLRRLVAEVKALRKRIKTMEQDTREDAQAAANEARWQEQQGEDYGSY